MNLIRENKIPPSIKLIVILRKQIINPRKRVGEFGYFQNIPTSFGHKIGICEIKTRFLKPSLIQEQTNFN